MLGFIGLPLTNILVVGAVCLLGIFVVKWGGIYLLEWLYQAGHRRHVHDTVGEIDDSLSRIPEEEARRRAEQLLADPEQFEVRPTSTVPPDELLSRVAPMAREFLTRYGAIVALPFGDTEIGSDWLRETADRDAISIGSSEYLGNLLMRVGDEAVYTDQRPNDGQAVAPTLFHLVILLANAEPDAV